MLHSRQQHRQNPGRFAAAPPPAPALFGHEHSHSFLSAALPLFFFAKKKRGKRKNFAQNSVLLMISAFSMLPMDIRSQGPQVPDRVLIAPLDMVDIADAGFPLRHEARYQQRRPAPQVR